MVHICVYLCLNWKLQSFLLLSSDLVKPTKRWLCPPVRWLLFSEPCPISHKKITAYAQFKGKSSFQFAVNSECCSYALNLLSDDQVEQNDCPLLMKLNDNEFSLIFKYHGTIVSVKQAEVPVFRPGCTLSLSRQWAVAEKLKKK